MTTNQPVWRFVANLGDVNPVNHGGFAVFEDTTGTYSPEAELLESPDTDPAPDVAAWQVRRFSLDRCTFINGILSDSKSHPELPAWFADEVASVAGAYGMATADLIAQFCSSETLDRAQAWRCIGEYFGYDNLDSYPLNLTRAEAVTRWTGYN